MLHEAHFSFTRHASFAPDISLVRLFFALEEMAVRPCSCCLFVDVARNATRTAELFIALRSGSLVKLRFATNTAAFSYASFAQDQQIKSNFNQANPPLARLFLSSHSMRARWYYPVSQITVS